jgi:hypothetical protein
MENSKRKYRLVSRLYYISGVAFLLFGLHFITIIAMDIFQEKPFENVTFSPSHITGYTMAAHLEVKTFDSIVNYKRIDSTVNPPLSESGEIVIENGKNDGFERSKIDSILKDSAYKKTIISQTKELRHGVDEANLGTAELGPGQIEASISVKSKNIWLTILLAIRNYATGCCILFILFQLTLLFRRLKNNFSFNQNLSRAIWLIGNALLLYQLLFLITGILVDQFLEYVKYSETVEGIFTNKEIMSLHITYDVSLTMVFIGLSLVVLSKLLEYGYELQEDNDLTI